MYRDNCFYHRPSDTWFIISIHNFVDAIQCVMIISSPSNFSCRIHRFHIWAKAFLKLHYNFYTIVILRNNIGIHILESLCRKGRKVLASDWVVVPNNKSEDTKVAQKLPKRFSRFGPEVSRRPEVAQRQPGQRLLFNKMPVSILSILNKSNPIIYKIDWEIDFAKWINCTNMYERLERIHKLSIWP